jgi:hypothetical protein
VKDPVEGLHGNFMDASFRSAWIQQSLCLQAGMTTTITTRMEEEHWRGEYNMVMVESEFSDFDGMAILTESGVILFYVKCRMSLALL